MALTRQYTDLLLAKTGLKVSPSKSLASRNKDASEFLRKMYLPGYKYYPKWDGKSKDKGIWVYPGIVPLAHLVGNDDYQENLKGLPEAIKAIGRLARWRNIEEHPNIRMIVENMYIPKCLFGAGTVPTKYMPVYNRAAWEAAGGREDEDDEFAELGSKSQFMVTINSPAELIEVASREAQFLNMSLDQALGRQWEMELTGITVGEGLANARLFRLLNAITAKDESTIKRIEAQVEKFKEQDQEL